MAHRDLRALGEVLRAPTTPSYPASPDDIARTEASLGIFFPQGYRLFVSEYGSGRIDDFIWVLTPSTKCNDLRIDKRGITECTATKAFIEEWSIKTPAPLYPDGVGVLPWAISDNADLLFLRPGTEAWVGVFPRQSNAWQVFECDVPGFLLGLLTRSLRVNCFPESFPPSRHIFEPERLPADRSSGRSAKRRG